MSLEPTSSEQRPVNTDLCPACGMPEDTPGYLRPPFNPGDRAGYDALIPCPKCNERKISGRIKLTTQLDGWLAMATLGNYGVNKDNRAAYDAVIKFIENPIGFLTLYGDYGTSKTHLLSAIVNALEGQAKYFTLPDLVSQYRGAVRTGDVEAFYTRISTIPVLVVDEVDKAHLKDWTKEQTYRLFDNRYRKWQKAGTVLAMNQNPTEASEDLGYLFSRMKDSRFKCVEVGGGDNRPNVELVQELAEAQNDELANS